MPKIILRGVEFNYEEQGYGNEIFIFGTESHSENSYMISLFPKNYHVYLLNLPNYYDVAHLKEFRLFNQWGEDVYAFARQLKIEKFIYVGISRWGGPGFYLAINHPEVVKAIIPIVSVLVPQGSMKSSKAQDTLQPNDAKTHFTTLENDLFPPNVNDKIRLQYRAKWRQHLSQNKMLKDEELLEKEQHLINRIIEGRWDLAARLGEVKVPTLLLFGAKDRTNPLEPVINSAMTIPGAKAVFFQDYGHGLCLEGPERVVNEVVLFVDEINRAQSG